MAAMVHGQAGHTDVWDDDGRYLASSAETMFIRGIAASRPVVDASGR